VHLANYYDALIDYPLCEQFFEGLLSMLSEGIVYDSKTIEELRMNAVRIKKKLDEDYNS